PPFFDGINYSQWIVKMTSFIQSLDYDLWDVIVFGPELPREHLSKPRIRYDEKEKEILRLNPKAKHLIFCALSPNEFNRISSCVSAKEIWDRLEDAYESSNQELKGAQKNLKKPENKAWWSESDYSNSDEENDDEATNLCLIENEETESDSEEEDASEEESDNEVSYDDLIKIVEKYSYTISSLKKNVKSLSDENNQLKSISLTNED
ncbi:DUF4219 domain-containing protein, partial [Cephalotus follicularis]